MAAGPLISAAGILLFLRCGIETSYVGDLLPALIVFSLGLAVLVAPLTATVLADADETDAGIASAINNAIARVAGLDRHLGDRRDRRRDQLDRRHVRAERSSRCTRFHVAIVICACARRRRRARRRCSGSRTRAARSAPRAARAGSSRARRSAAAEHS